CPRRPRAPGPRGRSPAASEVRLGPDVPLRPAGSASGYRQPVGGRLFLFVAGRTTPLEKDIESPVVLPARVGYRFGACAERADSWRRLDMSRIAVARRACPGAGALLAPLLAGCIPFVPVYYAYPTVAHVPAVAVEAPAAEVRAFRVAVTDDEGCPEVRHDDRY